jgi:oxygen-independent coproporphyrinogen-3 oxidase
MAGIYIHIPFCKQACHYCDFHFSTNTKLKAQMLDAIKQELALQQGYLGDTPIKSIYIGGGTPSVLTASEIEGLLDQVKKNYSIPIQTEITLEANPDDIHFDKLLALRSMGINRLSIGVQSFQDGLLKFINRVHDSKKALLSIELAIKAGFEQFNVDLIYGIPGQTDEMWKQDLSTVIQLQIKHISAYCLTIEQNTVFGRWQQQGRLQPLEEEIAARHFELLVGTMQANGYEHYEVSNFCLPGLYAQHNTNYWKKGKYLGVGPGAHSYDGTKRQYNIANNPRYIHSIQQNIIPSTVETLQQTDHINEYIMTSLRTQWGCDMHLLKSNYQYDLQQEKSGYLARLVGLGLAGLQDNKLILTTQGKLLADKIALDLFIAK